MPVAKELKALRADEDDDDGIVDPASPIDLMFDPWATSSGPTLSAISRRATQRLLEAGSQQRQREPKAEVVERLTLITSTVVANLAHLHRARPQGHRLAMPLKHTTLTRYDRPGFNMLPKIIDLMAISGLIIRHPPVTHKRRTGIEATGWLLEALTASPPFSDIGRAEGEEVIVLNARTGHDAKGKVLPKVFIDYQDMRTTHRLREEVVEINAFLSTKSIELYGEPQAGFRLTRRFTLRSPQDAIEFGLHGRLYGGFWINMPKANRAGLTINGEPIADLDFASMFPRMAYALVGAKPPEGDLYAIKGLEGHRAGVKAGLSALLSGSSEMARLPGEAKAALPAGWTASRFRNAVAEKHPALVPHFGQDFALDLMFFESCIMVDTLLRLARQGIAALPMHDGLMVAASEVAVAREVMEAVAERRMGSIIPVVRKA